ASKLTLYVADADDLSGLPSEQFDIIIINSVIQYFPSADYFLSVIDGLKPFLSSTGVIFIGDVICFPLCNAFNYETQFAKASPDDTVEKLLNSILTLTQVRNSETYYDPRFFHLLPGKFDWMNSVETQLRKGNFYNEMNNFRFDVIIRNVENHKQILEAFFLDWEKDALTLSKIQSILATNSHQVINIVNIPNARILRSNRLIELLKESKPTDTVDHIKNQLDKEMVLNSGLQPSLFWELENQDYKIEVDWDYEHWDGKMSVRCIHKEPIVFKQMPQNFSIVECSNRPAISSNESDVIQEIKNSISKELPDEKQPKEVFVISPRMYAMFNY
ncbi:MAG TPA: class I SAM-dependent methyltransferase, partial [Bacteroidia bacterium]|nr:class I SAM-dependent methyltransferase [Bacteroidia bacterium]